MHGTRSASRGRGLLRRSGRLLAALVSLCALAGTVRLVTPATAGPDGEPPGVARQLAFIRAALDEGAGDEAQGGPADVDSGPLPLGVSLSASVVTAGAAQVHGDTALAEGLTNHGELLGVPVDTPWTKRYAFGLLPIGDAFVAWSKTARPWVADSPSPPPPSLSWWWRLPLLTLLAVAAVLPWVPAAVRRLRGRREAQARDAVSLAAPEPRTG
ncbi:hypothetical protein [Streptomyces wuyuanensis]|uniref:hypothetical protein n=1 Tax=Streptomyces wuyuanensis TaxID=1196353 RepID=UPI00371EE976